MSEKMVSEKAILTEAAAAMVPEDLLWPLLADLGIGTRELPVSTVREVVLKHAERNGWPTAAVEATLSRLGAGQETE